MIFNITNIFTKGSMIKTKKKKKNFKQNKTIKKKLICQNPSVKKAEAQKHTHFILYFYISIILLVIHLLAPTCFNFP